MKIAFIADGRAEHARRWIEYFGSTDNEVLLLSTYPCKPLGDIDIRVLPGLFRPGNTFVKSSEVEDTEEKKPKQGGLVKLLLKYGVDSVARPIWHRLSSVDVIWQSRSANRILEEFQPDVVHALRIPNETFVLSRVKATPKIASAWGQDFIYNCKHYAIHRWLTKKALKRIDAFTADCERDLNLARDFGYTGAISRYFPTNGGVDFRVFSEGIKHQQRKPVLVYARGFGPYLRPDVLFECVAKLVPQFPELVLRVIAPPAQMEFISARIRQFGIPDENHSVEPFQSPTEWADTLQNAMAYVSPSVSDGTPNGMLESMACGALPIMGNIESVREWIEHRRNGFLFDPESSDALLPCLEECIRDWNFRQVAAEKNREIINERCSRETVFPAIADFYDQVAAGHHSGHDQ